ncbi:MAG: hypothetical protein GY866_10330, partial [Proteobacteria bacterium]|nr:hypothetical protein [Pseudomonadota bacterium]
LHKQETVAIGAKKQAEFVCQNVGLDLSPFIEKAEELAEQYTIENAQVTRTRGELEGLAVPQDDWPTIRLDPEAIRQEIELLNNHRRMNESKQLTVINAQSEINLKRQSVEEAKTNLEYAIQAHETQKTVHETTQKSYVEKCRGIDEYKAENPEKRWEGTQDIEEKIRVLMEEQKKKQLFEEEERKRKEKLVEMRNAVELLKKDADTALEKLAEKQTDIDTVRETVNSGNRMIEQLEEAFEKTEVENQPVPWGGEKDPEGKLFPDVFLANKMRSVTKNNKYIDDREKYLQAQNEEKLAVAARKKVG